MFPIFPTVMADDFLTEGRRSNILLNRPLIYIGLIN